MRAPIITVPVLGLPVVFGATVKETVPLPEPVPEVMLIQVSLVEADQPHAPVAVTLTLAAPPAPPKLSVS